LALVEHFLYCSTAGGIKVSGVKHFSVSFVRLFLLKLGEH